MYRQEYFPVPQTGLSPISPIATIPRPASRASSYSSSRPLRSAASLHDQRNVFVRQPWITYSKFLIFLIGILVMPFLISLGLTRSRGGVPAPQFIAEYSVSDPRTTAQFVTILASFFTASVRWALGGASTVLAQKRFKQPRPIVEMEIFSALKNGAVAWTWRRRQEAMFGTWVVVILTGLLTSGFVGLIAPFPIAVTNKVDAGWELNLFSNETSCYKWYQDTWNRLYCDEGDNGKCEVCRRVLTYGQTDFVYTGCPVQDQIAEVLNAAKTSMISHFAPSLPASKRSNLVYSFAQLANARLTGRTAGTVPTGPDGVHYFSDPTFRNVSKSTTSYNYTLDLQGIWADVSCDYIEDSASNLLVYKDSNGWFSYQTQCPEGFSPVQPADRVRDTSALNGLLLAGGCSNQATGVYTFDLRSFWSHDDYQDEALAPSATVATSARATATARSLQGRQPVGQPSASPSHLGSRQQTGDDPLWAYAGIDAMHCEFRPQAGPVSATFETEMAAFKMTHSELGTSNFSDWAQLTKDQVWVGMYQTLNAINQGQTEWSGNMLGGLIRTVSIAYGNLNGWHKDPLLKLLVADALKGIFEYEITNLRLVLTAVNYTVPDQICRRPVEGILVQRSIGWNSQKSTILGIIPLMLVGGLSIIMIIWAMMATGRLTVFDPTSPVSIIAATSVGDVAFYNDGEKDQSPLVGDPEDENVRDTKVQYGYHAGVWGLKSPEP